MTDRIVPDTIIAGFSLGASAMVLTEQLTHFLALVATIVSLAGGLYAFANQRAIRRKQRAEGMP